MAGRRHGLAAAALLVAAGLVGCAQEQGSASKTLVATQATDKDWRPKGLGAYLAARDAEIHGDTAAAAAYYPIALESDPDNVALLRRSYFFAAVEGRVEEASLWAQRLLVRDPGASVAPLIIASDQVAHGQFKAAAERLARQNRQGLNSFLVPVMLAWARLGSGHPPSALAALDDLDANPAYRPLKALHAALIQESLGNTEAARAAYEQYLSANDRPSLRGVQLAGGFLVRHGQGPRAQALATEYARRYPDSLLLDNTLQEFTSGRPVARVTTPAHGLAELFYGTASLLADNDATTAAMFNQLALYLRPDFALARLLMGQLLAGQGRHDDAIAAFRQVTHEPGLGLASGLAEAESLRAAKRIDEAAATLERLAEAYPQRADPLVDLGDMLRQAERFPEATDAYSRAIARLGPPQERHWAVFFGRGVTLERSNRWSEAEADFKVALGLSPDQPYVLNYLGYSWVDKGLNIVEAKAMIERAVTLRPKDGYIIDSLGWAHYRLGEYGEAVIILERAIREAPDDPTINDHLGDVYWVVGRQREARFQWRRALGLAVEAEMKTSLQRKLDEGLAPPVPVVPAPASAPAPAQAIVAPVPPSSAQ